MSDFNTSTNRYFGKIINETSKNRSNSTGNIVDKNIIKVKDRLKVNSGSSTSSISSKTSSLDRNLSCKNLTNHDRYILKNLELKEITSKILKHVINEKYDDSVKLKFVDIFSQNIDDLWLGLKKIVDTFSKLSREGNDQNIKKNYFHLQKFINYEIHYFTNRIEVLENSNDIKNNLLESEFDLAEKFLNQGNLDEDAVFDLIDFINDKILKIKRDDEEVEILIDKLGDFKNKLFSKIELISKFRSLIQSNDQKELYNFLSTNELSYKFLNFELFKIKVNLGKIEFIKIIDLAINCSKNGIELLKLIENTENEKYYEDISEFVKKNKLSTFHLNLILQKINFNNNSKTLNLLKNQIIFKINASLISYNYNL